MIVERCADCGRLYEAAHLDLLLIATAHQVSRPRT